jgi:hypothetical protein
MLDRSRLPPLAAVRAFEAAARLGSFTRAGAELGMTQAAVSYQIKLLEERVDAPLFLRLPRQVRLTETASDSPCRSATPSNPCARLSPASRTVPAAC